MLPIPERTVGAERTEADKHLVGDGRSAVEQGMMVSEYKQEERCEDEKVSRGGEVAG